MYTYTLWALLFGASVPEADGCQQGQIGKEQGGKERGYEDQILEQMGCRAAGDRHAVEIETEQTHQCLDEHDAEAEIEIAPGGGTAEGGR